MFADFIGHTMRAKKILDVALPWSGGCLSACLWQKGKGVIVSVPELDICCYGKSQGEAAFRLFSNLLRYYKELQSSTTNLSHRQEEHFILLESWVRSLESRMSVGELVPLRRY